MTSKPYFRLVVVLIVLALFGGVQYFFNIIPIRASKESSVPLAVELPKEVGATKQAKVDASTLPSFTPTKIAGPAIRAYWYPWTALHGVAFANGGVKTTSGSLMEKNGVKVQIVSQPDLGKSQTEQIKFAERLSTGDSNPAEGATFVITMGDGAAQYIAGVNKATKKLGPDYRAEVVGAVGYSGNQISGEDACMGPPEWQDDPAKAQGGLIAGYLRDGDWNLCLYWMQQNGLKNNPDETTYDPTAVNWFSTDDYLKAAEAYITGFCENRKVVRNGKITSEPKVQVCVQGVATWTPGDVNIAKKKGGLVKLISTKENAFQMPAVIIGIHKWNQDHPKLVTGFLKASFEGADQVSRFEPALNRAGKAAHEIYGDETPAYWVRYFKGVVERDRTNRPVPLGGSRLANFPDNLLLFGLAEGTGGLGSSIWRASYEGFGNIAKQQYPKLIPDFPGVVDATNVSFLQAIAETSYGKDDVADTPTYTQGGTISDVVAQRNWSIQFDTGRATIAQASLPVLDEVFNVLSVNKLYVQLDGHTDNTGTASVNVPLSEARADAIRAYLVKKAPTLFNGRIETKGYGDTKPIAPNTTAEGRAANRRVTITIGNK